MAVKATRKARSAVDSGPGELRIGLFDPGMTALHRAGLGGLWLTLREIDRHHRALRDDLRRDTTWSLDHQVVTFLWETDAGARRFFERLIRASFDLDEGRIWLLGRGKPEGQADRGTTLQDAVLTTFLQHGMTRKADPSAKPTGVTTVEIDGQSQGFTYRKVSAYNHQKATLDPFRPNDVVGWQFPGGAVRHEAFKGDTSLSEPPGAWLALLYGPAGALYFRVQRRAAGIRPQFCLVLPDVVDLDEYAEVRDLYTGTGVQDLVVSGAGEAALRVLSRGTASGAARCFAVERCTVVTFGVTPWASQQKTRIEVFEAAPVGEARLRLYRAAELLMPTVRRPPREGGRRGAAAGATGDDAEPGRPAWETSPVLDLIARNLIERAPWWRGFADLVADLETRRQFASYAYALWVNKRMRTGGLAEMVTRDGAFEGQEAAETIVRACHTAWRRRMGELSQRARDQGSNRNDLIDREYERLRVDFARCKSAATLRATLTDFWARAGRPIPELQHGWQKILPYLNEAHWQDARDLALLALVSYAAAEGDSRVPTTDDDTTGDASADDASTTNAN